VVDVTRYASFFFTHNSVGHCIFTLDFHILLLWLMELDMPPFFFTKKKEEKQNLCLHLPAFIKVFLNLDFSSLIIHKKNVD
jgi:hypothetical protein